MDRKEETTASSRAIPKRDFFDTGSGVTFPTGRFKDGGGDFFTDGMLVECRALEGDPGRWGLGLMASETTLVRDGEDRLDFEGDSPFRVAREEFEAIL